MSGNGCLLTFLLLTIAAVELSSTASAQDRSDCPAVVDIPTAAHVAEARAQGCEALARDYEAALAASGTEVAVPETGPAVEEPAAEAEAELPPGPLAGSGPLSGPGTPVARSSGGGTVVSTSLPGFLHRAPDCDGRGAGICWAESMGLILRNMLWRRTADNRTIVYAASVRVDGRPVRVNSGPDQIVVPVLNRFGVLDTANLVPYHGNLYVQVGPGRHHVEFDIYEMVPGAPSVWVGRGQFEHDPAVSGARHTVTLQSEVTLGRHGR